MNQQIREFKEKWTGYWNSINKKNKLLYMGIFISVIAALSLSIYFISNTKYVPLYTNEMSQKEIGDIKAELDREGYTEYRLDNNGTRIMVAEDDAANLIVSLASKGLPKTGTISFFDMTKDLQFGATDRQLDAMEREALQGEVAGLLKHVEGVENAAVMISVPQDSLFVREDDQAAASASVVIELEPGYKLEPQQIQVLYHLVSKSIPNLPKENIVMTDQGGQGLEHREQSAGVLDNYEQQRKIQKDIEADIQKDLQGMLGTIIGPNKVLIQTFVRLDFDQVKTQENLVEPVNGAANEGIAISVEEISKKYSGQDNSSEVSGTGQTDIPGDNAAGGTLENTSEELENRVNYEVNRITNDIVHSPYKVEDMTINVGVEPPVPNDPNSLTLETKENIQQILSNVVRTALSDNPALTDEDVTSRISVFAREFSGKVELPKTENKASVFPAWGIYALSGVGALVLFLLLFVLFRRRKSTVENDDPFSIFNEEKREYVKIEEEEKVVIKKQIEQMAQQHPEEFIGLLRNWLSKD